MNRIGCCIPGGSFMPQGEKSTDSALSVLQSGAAYALQNGYDYAEATVGLLMKLTDEELAAAVQNGTRIEVCNSFIPGNLSIMEGDPALEGYVDEAMRRMHLLGCDTVVLGSGGARRVPEGMSADSAMAAFERFLVLCNRYGEKHDITVVLEPLNRRECNFLNLVSEGYDIARRVSLPRIHLLADAYHMGLEDEPFSVLRAVASELRHVHVAEATVRTYPGKESGSDFLPRFAASLRAAGYEGRVTVECSFSDFLAEAPLAAIFMKKYF